METEKKRRKKRKYGTAEKAKRKSDKKRRSAISAQSCEVLIDEMSDDDEPSPITHVEACELSYPTCTVCMSCLVKEIYEPFVQLHRKVLVDTSENKNKIHVARIVHMWSSEEAKQMYSSFADVLPFKTSCVIHHCISMSCNAYMLKLSVGTGNELMFSEAAGDLGGRTIGALDSIVYKFNNCPDFIFFDTVVRVLNKLLPEKNKLLNVSQEVDKTSLKHGEKFQKYSIPFLNMYAKFMKTHPGIYPQSMVSERIM